MRKRQLLMLELVRNDLIRDILKTSNDKKEIERALKLDYKELFDIVYYSSKTGSPIICIFTDGIPMPF